MLKKQKCFLEQTEPLVVLLFAFFQGVFVGIKSSTNSSLKNVWLHEAIGCYTDGLMTGRGHILEGHPISQ